MSIKLSDCNDRLRRRVLEAMGESSNTTPKVPTVAPTAKPLLNKTETRWRDVLVARGCKPVLEQAITLQLDPPFKSYRPDLAYWWEFGRQLVLVEVKGPHRFKEKGIAKAALAAKTYPMFRFELAEWTGQGWKESVLSP